jgi:hypothetical protein
VGVEEHDDWLQDRYARWLDALTKLAFALTAGTFAVYVTGILAPAIPIAELPRVWGLPLDEYLARTGAPTGWGWLGSIAYGDYLNYVGMSLFACVALLSNLAIVLPLARRGERLMAALVAAQIVVLAVAASGLLSG